MAKKKPATKTEPEPDARVTLYVDTEGYDDRPTAARLVLTRTLAQALLRIRPQVLAAQRFAKEGAVGVRFFSIEFFNELVDFGRTDDGADPGGEWRPVRPDPGFIVSDRKVETQTLVATDTGVFWRAMERHGHGQVETYEIPWPTLATFASGQDPWEERTT